MRKLRLKDLIYVDFDENEKVFRFYITDMGKRLAEQFKYFSIDTYSTSVVDAAAIEDDDKSFTVVIDIYEPGTAMVIYSDEKTRYFLADIDELMDLPVAVLENDAVYIDIDDEGLKKLVSMTIEAVLPYLGYDIVKTFRVGNSVIVATKFSSGVYLRRYVINESLECFEELER